MKINEISFGDLGHKEYLIIMDYITHLDKITIGTDKKDIFNVKKLDKVEGNPPRYYGLSLEVRFSDIYDKKGCREDPEENKKVLML